MMLLLSRMVRSMGRTVADIRNHGKTNDLKLSDTPEKLSDTPERLTILRDIPRRQY